MLRSATPNHDRLTDDRPARPDSRYFDDLIERVQKIHSFYKQKSPDYYAERYEFGDVYTQQDAYRYKARPYHDWDSLMNLQFLGHVLKNDSPAGIAIGENWTSYVIGRGISFDVKPKAAFKESSEVATLAKDAQQEINQHVADSCWASVQQELVRDRLVPSGDVIRQWDSVNDRIDWTFHDSHELRPPDRTNGGVQIAPFGIEFTQGQIRRPSQYWIDNTPIPTRSIQHAKIGGDSRDPRGWPMLAAGFCDLQEVDELDYAATMSGIAYSRNTIVRTYPEDHEGDLAQIARGVAEQDREAVKQGLLNAGGGTAHARGFTIEGLAAQWSATGFIDLMDFKLRYVANMASIPEFIATGKADTGSRNTLISAEGPLTRRVERAADFVGKFDVDFFYVMLAINRGWWGLPDYDERLAELKSQISITPTPKTPDSRDRIEKDRLTMDMADRKFIGPFTAMRNLGAEPDEVFAEHKQFAEQAAEFRDDLRSDSILNDFQDAEELAERMTIAQAMVSFGFTEDEALEKVGLDPIADRTALDEAIERRNMMADLAATTSDTPPPPAPEETTTA